MAMNVGSGTATSDPEVMMDINTTPLIDVMLVLLVMLIITIPIQLHSVNLNLPTGNPPPPLVLPEVVKIDIDPSSVVYWNGLPLADRAALEENLKAASAQAVQAGQERQVRDRRRRDGIGAATGADQDRHRRQRTIHRVVARRERRRATGVKTKWISHGSRETRPDI